MIIAVSTEKFLQYLEREKRYSANTLVSYSNDLRQFLVYFREQYELEDLEEIKAPMVRSWLAQAMKQGMARTSINRKLSSLKSFFRFALKHGLLQENPMEKVMSVKKNKVLPVFVKEEEMNRLLDQTAFEPGFAGKRDRLIMELLYTTGMRLSELCALRHEDFDSGRNLLKVIGKRAKQRLIPVIPEVADHFRDYFEEKERVFGNLANPHIFLTDRGLKVYPKFVYRLVNKYLGGVTTRSRKSPHVLRHSFATHMLDHGADLNVIKEILGHANLSATQVYTHNSIEKIKNVYKQAHPKA